MLFKLAFFTFVTAYSDTISSNETFVDRPQLRTLAVIEQRGDTGRLVLLICAKKKHCQKQRSEVPEWIRHFNEDHGYTGGKELIAYHFYAMGSPLSIIAKRLQFPALVYIIAKTPHYFQGDINDQFAVKTWLEELDEVSISKPSSYDDITKIFAEVTSGDCNVKYLLMLNNEIKCPFPNWPIIARQVASKHNIRPVQLYAPLATDTVVALYRRMKLLPQKLCRTLILLTQSNYHFLPDIVSTAEISEYLVRHFSTNSTECNSLVTSAWSPLRPPLTELELIFFTGEHELFSLEHRWSYIWIGIVGGCAVCTLAVSIFWGLNG